MKNNLIKIIAVLAFIFLTYSTNIFGQDAKFFKATSISTKTYSEGKWGEWSSNQKIDHWIILDINNNKITIDDGRAESALEIVNIDKTINKYGVTEYKFECMQNGVKCAVLWIFEKEMMVYLLYANTQILFGFL